jgi:regulatory protein
MKTREKAKLYFEAAYFQAVRLLGRRAHSRYELAQKLRQRGHADRIIAQVLARCEEHRYIDDATTCDSYCCELIRKGFGPRMIRQRLAGRGIAAELIQNVLEVRYPPEIVVSAARTVAAHKSHQLGNRFREKMEVRTRLARFLTQRGFPSDIIHEILNTPPADNSI